MFFYFLPTSLLVFFLLFYYFLAEVCVSFIWFLFGLSALFLPGPLLAGSRRFPVLFPGKLRGGRRRVEPAAQSALLLLNIWAETGVVTWAGGVPRSARCPWRWLAQLSLLHMLEEASGVSNRGLAGRHAKPPTLSCSLPSYYRCFCFQMFNSHWSNSERGVISAPTGFATHQL